MSLSELAIPKYVIPPIAQRGEIFFPKAHDLESGIIQSMEMELIRVGPILQSGFHSAVALDSPSPHNPDLKKPHVVLWVYKNNPKNHYNVPLWNENSWNLVSDDREFLIGLDEKLDELQYISPDSPQRVYFFIGFAQPSENYPKQVYRRGLQTQYRWHIHIASPITEDDPLKMMLDFTNQDDLIAYTQMMNEAQYRSIEYFNSQANDFGEPIIYQQKLGRGQKPVTIPHVLYGFHTLEYAIKQCLSFRKQINKEWLKHAMEINSKYFDKNTRLNLDIQQSRVPNFGIIRPSFIDRKNGMTDDNYKYWVVLLPVAGGQSMLTPGGVMLAR